MPFILLCAFIGVPLAEIAVFIEVGGLIGLWPTLAIVIATAFAGTALLRAQGLATFNRAQHNLAEGRLPMAEIMHGFFLVIAGALLLTPGFLTDAAGLALFVPAVRRWLGARLGRWLATHGRIHAGRVRAEMHAAEPGPPGFAPEPGPVIDADAREIPPRDTEPPRPAKPSDTPWRP